MRLLILQENGRHDENREFRECFSVRRAVEKLGHEADVWGLGHTENPALPDFAAYDAILSLEDYDSGWHPDLGRLKVPKAYWCRDAHCGVSRYQGWAARHRFDLIFSASVPYVDSFQRYCGCAEWLPNAYDETLIDRIPTVPKSIRFGFVGTPAASPQRERLLDRMRIQYDLHIDAWVLGRDMVKAMNAYYVAFNFNIGDDINYRTFEALGSGTCLVTNETPGLRDLFGINEHLLVYQGSDPDEVVEYAFEHPDHVIQIAGNGYRHVRAHHTYTHRVARILERLGWSAREI